MGTPLSYAAGAAADSLEEQLKQMFLQQLASRKASQDDTRIGIEQQTANDNSAYRRMQEQDRQAQEQANQQLAKLKGAETFAGSLPTGTALSSGGLSMLAQGGMAGPEFVQHKDATLGSTNLTGAADAGTASPALRIVGTANPGQAASDTFLGTAQRQTADQARQDRIAAAAQARQDAINKQRQDAVDKMDLATTIAGLRTPAQAPQPQIFFDKDGGPHAIQFSGGQANDIALPSGLTGKTAPKPAGGGKLSSQQQGEVENYDAVIREADRIQGLLKKTGLDQDNNPLASHPRAFIAQKLGVTQDDPTVDQLLQNVGYLQSIALRSAAGNQRMTANLQQVFQQHVPSPDAPGKRIALLTGELKRQLGDRRADVYKIAGATDPNAVAVPANETPEQRIQRILGGG